VVRSKASVGIDRLLSVCREVKVTKVSRDFLAANRRYDGLARRIGRMLSLLIEDASESVIEFSATDGDLDDERLIELLSDPGKSDGNFLEFFEESGSTLSVIVGLDVSGSTAMPISGGGAEGITVLDVEKHFALILSRALGLLTRKVEVLAFNTGSGTNIYRPSPLEALTSLDSGEANRDGDFVRYCVAELAGMEADLRYLFLISDGMPCAEGYEGRAALDDTILSFREARKAGVRIVYLNIDSGELDYFDEFADEVLYAERFRRPEELIYAAPELVRCVAREVL
jgi:hypothetical protein